MHRSRRFRPKPEPPKLNRAFCPCNLTAKKRPKRPCLKLCCDRGVGKYEIKTPTTGNRNKCPLSQEKRRPKRPKRPLLRSINSVFMSPAIRRRPERRWKI